MKKVASSSDPQWYKDAVIYELHVRAFSDSNGDGIGDFPGLISRLDYLQDLGVTCIWLLPFFPSPLRDDGYDIANYVDVNPSYGTLNDFKMFLDAAHRLNMQVMIELVINHTSDQHPWFQAARHAPAGSSTRNMYVWSATDQLYKDARIIFTDTEKSNWTWDETAQAYYWHRFFAHQPDLNFDNPIVIDEVLKAMRFWLDLGVDALRIDAIPYLVERDGTSCENLPQTHEVVKKIRAAIDADYSNRLILAEANQWPADVRPYFGDGDECHMAFHFPLMPRIYMALRQEDRQPIIDIMARTPPIPDNCQWGLFLRNHDELTLEMVTDDERDYMYFAYSADPHMRINVGIRRRLAPLVDNNSRRIELLNSLLLSFPGTPILYYGDEIGMGDNIYLGDRNGVRTPMQWNSDRNAGFSRCDPARLYLPVVMDPIYGYQAINVEAQLSDPSSLLHWTRNMIALRKLFKVFGRGSLKFFNPANRKVLAYLRDLAREDGSHETVLCVANLSRFAQPVSLDLSDYAGSSPVEMLGYVPFPLIERSPYALTLAPYSFLWLELQPANVQSQQLGFEDLQSKDANEASMLEQELLVSSWTEMLAGLDRGIIEEALSTWLPHQRWFGAKARAVRSVQIESWVELPPNSGPSHAPTPKSVTAQNIPSTCALIFVNMVYADDSSDVYQLPLAMTVGDTAREIESQHPRSIVLHFQSMQGPAILHDATVLVEFRDALLELIVANTTLPLAETEAQVQLNDQRASVELVDASAAAQNTSLSARHEMNADRKISPANLAHAHRTPVIPEADVLHISAEVASPRASQSQQNSDGAPLNELSVEDSHLSKSLGNIATAPAPLTAQPGEVAADVLSDAASVNSMERAASSENKQGQLEGRAFGSIGSRDSIQWIEQGEHLPSHVATAEQSNTSILYGSKFILKLFRRLEAGDNPDVEMGRFLTETAHFEHTAPLFGEIAIHRAGSSPTTSAMMQGLVENDGDGWQWFLGQLRDFLAFAHMQPAPQAKIGTTSFAEDDLRAGLIARYERDPEAMQSAGPALRAIALLGQRTAELHLALSDAQGNLAFAPEPFTKADLERDAERIEAQIAATFAALKAQFATLTDESTPLVARLLTQREEMVACAQAICVAAPSGQRIRIHGDYHLGQVLHTPASVSNAKAEAVTGDFVLLDFEGEPARSLAERQQKQSPLKDVAGMLRSISYIAQTALTQFRTERELQGGQSSESFDGWVLLWQNIISDEFLHTYQTTIATNPQLLPDAPQAHAQLRAYLLGKALYELLYELNNRPEWLRVPLAGILAM